MVEEALENLFAAAFAESGPERGIAFADDARGSETELVARGLLGHATDIAADQLHGIAPVAHPAIVATLGLGGGAVDDGDEVIGDDDSVLACLLWALGDQALFDDIHCYCIVSR